MSHMNRLWLFAALFLPTVASAQVSVDWSQPIGGISLALGAANSVYTVNYDYNPAGDITLTCREADGTFRWDSKFDQTENSKWEKATWVAADRSGNALVSGTLMSGYSNPVNAASILMKFSPTGTLLWRRVYESSFDGSYTRMCLLDATDNVYVLGMGSGPAGYTMKVKKFGPDGTPLWTWSDASGIGAPTNFKFAPNGDLLLVGRSIYGSINGYARIDRNGALVWAYPGVSSLTVGDAAGDAEGNTYLVHGEYVANGGSVIRKLAPTGGLLWSRTFGLAASRIEVGSDGHPVACGFPNANTAGAAFIKVDPSGGLIWANLDADGPLALLLHARLILDRFDNAYLAAGTLFDMAICKVASNGTSCWTVTTPGSYANHIALGTDDHLYVVGGRTARLVENLISNVPDGGGSRTPRLAQNSPNPFRTTTTIRFRLDDAAPVSLRLYDVSGREVRELVHGVQPAGDHVIRLEAGELPAGVYYYRLRQGHLEETRALTILP